MSSTVLELDGVRKYFPVHRAPWHRATRDQVRAVDGVNLAIKQGETFSIVGESGCGKTTLARLVLLLERITAGTIRFAGQDISKLGGGDLRRYRRSVQAVFQDPYSSLSPRMRVDEIIAEPLIVSGEYCARERREQVALMVDLVGLPRDVILKYPHELSGGQRQRVALARAAASHPSLIVLDEPVSALDVSVQAQIVNLLEDTQDKLNTAYMLISHDLAVVEHMSRNVAVMYLGEIVEIAARRSLYAGPLHPYTQALISATLPLHPDAQRKEIVLQGEVASSIRPPVGCRFHPRCFRTKPLCAEVKPVLAEVSSDHKVACHYAGE